MNRGRICKTCKWCDYFWETETKKRYYCQRDYASIKVGQKSCVNYKNKKE